MTSLKQSYKHNDHTTDVTVDWDSQVATVESTATSAIYHVYKPLDQTAFFKIKTNKYKPPAQLEGHWNGIQKAIDAILKYLTDTGETQTMKNIRLDRDRKERNAAKTESKSS